MIDSALIIFARFPEEGKVKTRLAIDFGDSFAAGFYKTCAEHTFNVAMNLDEKNTTSIIFCSDKSDLEKIKNWTGDKFRVEVQHGNNLGEKMMNAFNLVFSAGFKKATIIGTDLPGISAELILQANDYLLSYDFVIGPSKDGGYYLLAMKKLRNQIFSGINWGTSGVLHATKSKISSLGCSCYLMDEKYDVDTKDSLLNWMTIETDRDNPVFQFVRKYN